MIGLVDKSVFLGHNGHLSIKPSELLEFTDLGNAKRFCADHLNELRFVTGITKWIYWTGRRWEFDDRGEAQARAHDTVENMLRDAVDIQDTEERKKAVKWALVSQGVNRLNAIVALARSIREMTIDLGVLDANPDLLNVRNGTIDLTTGELLEHDRDDFISKIAPVIYDPAATCPRWMQFIDEIFEEKADLIQFVQTALGYSLTASTGERCFFILHGSGANGKSVLMETMLISLGDYAQTARSELFVSQRVGGASEGEAALKGARFVLTSESGAKQRFNEAVVKRLTGRDTIRARFLYANEFEFAPTHKIWFATNHKPAVDDSDDAIWDRIRLIPFGATFKGERADKDLPDKLKREASGILNWIIEGELRWRVEGLKPPMEVTTATSNYRDEMNILAGFLEDCCIVGDDFGGKVKSSQLYKAYRNWCDRTGEKPIPHKAFGQRLVTKGFEKTRSNAGNYYHGIGLKDENVG